MRRPGHRRTGDRGHQEPLRLSHHPLRPRHLRPPRHERRARPPLPAGKRAHATKNCARIPGKKKGSCNEPHRKCRQRGAKAVSSKGIHLTCRIARWDGRLRWLAKGE
ncbi:hypothetical protein [Streptomyces sp. MST-110588]|uniref:hypothetical protein n=1 Tax=Streptomyces sp. MST-110588 TaxID=2833628 RepID=UPI001F5D9A78|nr:hypothetical protein [Streptomyces sp. MST-110588]UNO39805.1 hypothetical protein KGS77_09645 [Streptomyces sp. MST-110588]